MTEKDDGLGMNYIYEPIMRLARPIFNSTVGVIAAEKGQIASAARFTAGIFPNDRRRTGFCNLPDYFDRPSAQC